MTLQTFAQVSDLQNFTGETYVTATATQALYVATTVIQSYCQQTIFQVTDDQIVCDPLPNVSVRLPERPTTAVTAISTLDDSTNLWTDLDVSQWRWIDYGWLYATRRYDPCLWPTDLGTVRVTYTHGYAVVPDAAVNVCTTMAARLISNPLFLNSQAMGMVNATYTPAASLNVFEMAMLSGLVQAGMA